MLHEMTDAANIEEPSRHVRDQSNTEIAPEEGVEELDASDASENNASNHENAQPSSNGVELPKKPSKFKQLYENLGLDVATALMMLKLVYVSHPPGLPFVPVQFTYLNTKGVSTSDNCHSLVSIERYFWDIRHPWLPCANSYSLVHGKSLIWNDLHFITATYLDCLTKCLSLPV
jgi:hypothetical protein